MCRIHLHLRTPPRSGINVFLGIKHIFRLRRKPLALLMLRRKNTVGTEPVA